MKKLVAVCLCILTLFTMWEIFVAVAKQNARVSDAAVTLDDSAVYSEQELKAAVNVVKHRFMREWPGTLRSITYNEKKTAAAAAVWAQRCGADEAVILSSDFVADARGRVESSGLTPGHVYTGWQWILVRSHGGRWKLKMWGYG